jgi:hypothetical protein
MLFYQGAFKWETEKDIELQNTGGGVLWNIASVAVAMLIRRSIHFYKGGQILNIKFPQSIPSMKQSVLFRRFFEAQNLLFISKNIVRSCS